MYSQENQRSHSLMTYLSFGLIVVIFFGLIAAGYIFITKSSDSSYEKRQDGSGTQAPTETFNSNPLSVQSGQSSNTTEASSSVEQQPESTEEDKQPSGPRFSITDANFTSSSLETTLDPCKDGSIPESTTASYSVGTATFTIHENFTASGCGDAVVPDAELTYEFTDSGKSLKFTDLTKFPQCSKDQNSACPKGDGKITLHIVLRQNEDPTQFQISPLSNNFYFFEIEETNLKSDLTAQVNELAHLIENVILN